MKQQITKAAIETAFRGLLQSKPFEKITVKDIVEECGLTRNTFYYYYEDTYDVFREIIENEVAEVMDGKDDGKSWEEALLTALRFALNNQSIAEQLLKSRRRDELETCFENAIEAILSHYFDHLTENLPCSARDKTLLLNFYTHALQGELRAWLTSGMKTPLEKNLKRLNFLLGDSVKAALMRGEEQQEE